MEESRVIRGHALFMFIFWPKKKQVKMDPHPLFPSETAKGKG